MVNKAEEKEFLAKVDLLLDFERQMLRTGVYLLLYIKRLESYCQYQLLTRQVVIPYLMTIFLASSP